jgi:transposase
MVPGSIKVFVARDRTDMRKSYDSLSLLVQEALEMDPLSGYIFVFFNKRSDRMKALYWDRNGFCLWQKRLEKGHFRIPSITKAHWEVGMQELQMLLSGIDIRILPTPFNVEDYAVN